MCFTVSNLCCGVGGLSNVFLLTVTDPQHNVTLFSQLKSLKLVFCKLCFMSSVSANFTLFLATWTVLQ